jgi:tRNA A37 threonylcarbamoyladenosine synthetase subunit TsaC/SUA5/YrdC
VIAIPTDTLYGLAVSAANSTAVHVWPLPLPFARSNDARRRPLPSPSSRADGTRLGAVQSVYAIKGRASTKPLAICVAEVADVAVYAHTEHLPAGLLQQLFPGACHRVHVAKLPHCTVRSLSF